MQQIVNLREANQNLSKYIRSLQEGDEIIITKHGKAVARLISVTEKKILDAAQKKALQRLLRRKITGYHIGGNGNGISRDELYDR
jgi:prevent-host-death family protein